MADSDENPFGDPTPSVGHPFQVIFMIFLIECAKNIKIVSGSYFKVVI